MIIITSPAKTLDYESVYPEVPVTIPQSVEKAAALVEILKLKSQNKLAKIMHISPELAQINYDRYQHWNPNHTLKNSRPALFAYNGDIFKELQRNEYSLLQLQQLNKTLRILSGLYGIVKPFDLIEPYRLEMNAVIPGTRFQSLYAYWKDLTKLLSEDVKQSNAPFILNLASEEYSRVINKHKLPVEMITVEFRQRKNGVIMNYGLLAKRARGMMIDFIAQNMITTLDQVEHFHTSDYVFEGKHKNSLLFVKDLTGDMTNASLQLPAPQQEFLESDE